VRLCRSAKVTKTLRFVYLLAFVVVVFAKPNERTNKKTKKCRIMLQQKVKTNTNATTKNTKKKNHVMTRLYCEMNNRLLYEANMLMLKSDMMMEADGGKQSKFVCNECVF
jgi:hypothetical protein